MPRKHKLPIVLAALLVMLGAAAEIATGRARVTSDPATSERARQDALARVDGALARQDVSAAVAAWQEAYELARRTRSSRALVEAGDAHLRIGAAAHASAAATPRAREIYLAALARARAERSVDGVVRAAERFAALGDHEVTVLALRIADSLAARSPETDAARRVEVARGRLLAQPSDVARITF